MRVIAGTAKGTTLRSPSASGTRPISDRSKEALFSILAADVPGSSFLDLFAGTGGVGIEALSRGARLATFVELSRTISSDLLFNLNRTHVADRATVVTGDAFQFLAQSPTPYDIIFVAPPQWRGLWQKAIRALDVSGRWWHPHSWVIAQHDAHEDGPIELRNLSRVDTRRYGGVQFVFYRPHLV
jgi:16S rRNA (guanine966-N2)-methyltransferase